MIITTMPLILAIHNVETVTQVQSSIHLNTEEDIINAPNAAHFRPQAKPYSSSIRDIYQTPWMTERQHLLKKREHHGHGRIHHGR